LLKAAIPESTQFQTFRRFAHFAISGLAASRLSSLEAEFLLSIGAGH
jgi:hypothetical protein